MKKLLPSLPVVLALAAGCGALQPRAPMSDGQRLYLDKCTSCHDAYEPHEFTPDKWKEAVREMEGNDRITLTVQERTDILQYLTGAPVVSPR
jgi:hypothetical protein